MSDVIPATDAWVTEAMEACETCDGWGYFPHHRMTWHDVDCPDCRDGWRVAAPGRYAVICEPVDS